MEFEERVEQDRDVIERAQLSHESSRYVNLLKVASLTKDSKLLETVEKMIAPARIDLEFSELPMLKVPKKEDVSGDIVIGTLAQDNAVQVGLKLEDIQREIVVVGPVGSGKTTFLDQMRLALLNYRDSAHPNGIPWIEFDWKQDTRHLKDPRIRVIRWEWLKLALFKPPSGVNPRIWADIKADIFTHVMGILYASENVLIESLHSLYEKRNWKSHPTFNEVLDMVDNMPTPSAKEAEYRAVLLNRLKSLKMTLGEVLDCSEGISVEDSVLPYPTVIELDGCPRDAAHFLVAWFIAQIVAYRVYNNMRGALESVIIFDEATRLFFDRSQSFVDRELGASFLETVPQYIRDYKLGMIFALQEPSIASRSLWANTNTKIIAGLSEGDDITKVIDTLYLTKDYEQKALTKLQRGFWIVKKQGLDPFLLKTEDFPKTKDVTTEQLKERMQPILDRIIPKEQGKASPELKLRELKVPDLSQDAYDLFRDIASHPVLGITGHARSLKISIRRMERAKDELLERKLIEGKEVSFGTFRPAKFLIPTAMGLQVLQDLGVNTSMVKHILTQGVSFEHVVYQVLIRYAYRNLGYATKIEYKVGDRRVDVWVEGHGERIAIEVELTTIGTVSDKPDIINMVDRLVLVFKDKRTLEESKKVIEEKFQDKFEKIEFKQIGQYLEELRSKREGGRSGTNP